MKIQGAIINVSLMALTAAGILMLAKRATAPKLIRDARGLVYDNAESAKIFADDNKLFGIK